MSLDGRGWVVLERLLDADEVAAIRADLRPLVDAATWGTNSFFGRRTKRVFGLPAKVRSLDPVIAHPVVLAELDAVLPPAYLLSTSVAVEIHPGESAQTPHDDGSAWPGPHERTILVNAILALDDFTPDNGATVLDGEPVVMPAGSVLLYRGDVVHGGGANTTDRPRLAVIHGYLAPWLRQQENFTLTCPPALARTLPARLQRLLGYELFPPFIGHVDGRDPGELLS